MIKSSPIAGSACLMMRARKNLLGSPGRIVNFVNQKPARQSRACHYDNSLNFADLMPFLEMPQLATERLRFVRGCEHIARLNPSLHEQLLQKRATERSPVTYLAQAPSRAEKT
jgi:hypothetical protein